MFTWIGPTLLSNGVCFAKFTQTHTHTPEKHNNNVRKNKKYCGKTLARARGGPLAIPGSTRVVLPHFGKKK